MSRLADKVSPFRYSHAAELVVAGAERIQPARWRRRQDARRSWQDPAPRALRAAARSERESRERCDQREMREREMRDRERCERERERCEREMREREMREREGDARARDAIAREREMCVREMRETDESGTPTQHITNTAPLLSTAQHSTEQMRERERCEGERRREMRERDARVRLVAEPGGCRSRGAQRSKPASVMMMMMVMMMMVMVMMVMLC